MKRILMPLLVGLAFACGVGAADAEALNQADASSLIAHLTEEAVTTLSAKGLSREQRAQSLRELFARYSSAQKLSEDILGKAWTTASVEERTRFEKSFVEYLVALCTGMVGEMSPETRIFVKGSEAQGDQVLVHSLVVTADGDRTPVDWSVAARDGRLILADVSTEGVSLIRTMRSDFRAVLFANAGRIDALIAAMNHKATVAAN
jgi:phospholipid transport system substrate-binding protein